jgi:mono/diheme cytochrome c family protein
VRPPHGSTQTRTLASLLAASACLALVHPASAEPVPIEPSPVDKGRAALESRCSRCHAIGPEGASPHPEAPPFREIVKRYPPESLEESLAEGIDSGHPDMPTFVLAPEEIETVVLYLKSLVAE